MSIFYENYLNICTMSGRTPTRAAIEIGVGKSTVTSWKTGKSSPTDATMAKICNYFGCLPQHLKEEGGSKRFSDYINVENRHKSEKTTPTGKEPGERLTDKEIQLLSMFRRLTEDRQETILIQLSALSSAQQS